MTDMKQYPGSKRRFLSSMTWEYFKRTFKVDATTMRKKDLNKLTEKRYVRLKSLGTPAAKKELSTMRKLGIEPKQKTGAWNRGVYSYLKEGKPETKVFKMKDKWYMATYRGTERTSLTRLKPTVRIVTRYGRRYEYTYVKGRRGIASLKKL